MGSSATPARGVLPGEPWLPPVPLAPLLGDKSPLLGGLGGHRRSHHAGLMQLCSPHWEARAITHRGAQRKIQDTLLPLHAKGRHNPSLKCPRQVLSQARVPKGLYIFEKVYLAFRTSRKSKNLYLSLDLVVCQQQLSLPSIISSTYTQYWIRLFSYRKVSACKISLRIRPSPWQTQAFLQEAAAM